MHLPPGVHLQGLGPGKSFLTRDDFFANGFVVWLDENSSIDGFTFPDCDSDTAITDVSATYYHEVSNIVISGGLTTGIVMLGGLIEHVTFNGCHYGVSIGEDTTIRYCIFQNLFAGIRVATSNDDVNNHDNCFWGNYYNYHTNAEPGPGEFEADPQLDTNFVPAWTSPVLDRAGDTGADGSPGELGGIERYKAPYRLYFAEASGPALSADFTAGDHFDLRAEMTNFDPYDQTVEVTLAMKKVAN